jgi:hypothetical protein
MPPACRFHPSCSAYGLEAFQTHPFHRALVLTVWRIMRCNPFNAGGYDPVPPRGGSSRDSEHQQTGDQTNQGAEDAAPDDKPA